jgi:hypothetical protein
MYRAFLLCLNQNYRNKCIGKNVHSVLIARTCQQASTSACPVSTALARDYTLKYTSIRRDTRFRLTYGALLLRHLQVATDETRAVPLQKWQSWRFKRSRPRRKSISFLRRSNVGCVAPCMGHSILRPLMMPKCGFAFWNDLQG